MEAVYLVVKVISESSYRPDNGKNYFQSERTVVAILENEEQALKLLGGLSGLSEEMQDLHGESVKKRTSFEMLKLFEGMVLSQSDGFDVVFFPKMHHINDDTAEVQSYVEDGAG